METIRSLENKNVFQNLLPHPKHNVTLSLSSWRCICNRLPHCLSINGNFHTILTRLRGIIPE